MGIGFGLQTLVNNLVSGLIIAFEKPVNVGDDVDINGQSGIMKSIGFRSSVISTYDGSDIIIPNGDLLNAHLINWTLGETKRRVEVLIGNAVMIIMWIPRLQKTFLPPFKTNCIV